MLKEIDYPKSKSKQIQIANGFENAPWLHRSVSIAPFRSTHQKTKNGITNHHRESDHCANPSISHPAWHLDTGLVPELLRTWHTITSSYITLFPLFTCCRKRTSSRHLLLLCHLFISRCIFYICVFYCTASAALSLKRLEQWANNVPLTRKPAVASVKKQWQASLKHGGGMSSFQRH